MSQTVEAATPKHTTGIIRRRMLVFSALAAPVIGGILGYAYGEHSEQQDNRSDARKAVSYTRCITDVQRLGLIDKATKASDVPRDVQNDCQITDAIVSLKHSYKQGALDASSELPAGAKFTYNVDPIVQLPSVAQLNQDIQSLKHSARTVDSAFVALTTIGGLAVPFAAEMAMYSFSEMIKRQESLDTGGSEESI